MTYENYINKISAQDWELYSNWHELFDTLCMERDQSGNYDLAFLVCKKAGKFSQKEIESAARNLSNWRSGANLPSRKNFRVLTEVLDVSKNQELTNYWQGLYHSELKTRPFQTVLNASKNKSSYGVEIFGKNISISILLHSVLYISTLAATVIFINWYTDDIRILAKNSIVWRKNVSLTVGQKIVVHGKKGACGRMPPRVENILPRLPKNLITGKLTTGELGLRASNGCNGLTPAREIVFEAMAPGQETFFLFGNDINVQIISKQGEENYAIEQ